MFVVFHIHFKGYEFGVHLKEIIERKKRRVDITTEILKVNFGLQFNQVMMQISLVNKEKLDF